MSDTQRFLERFFSPPNQLLLQDIESSAPDEGAGLIRPWIEFLRRDPPESTVLPCRRHGSAMEWYGVASSEKQLRALGEELLAFVGPTYAGFRGQRATLDPADPVEAAVLEFTGGRAFRLRSPAGGVLWRALKLMHTVRTRRVDRKLDVPRTTARALYDFRIAVLGGSRDEAEADLRYLRDGHRLDAANLLFLQVQMLAGLRRWREILDLSELPTLLEAARPFAVTQALVSAVYHEEIAPSESMAHPETSAQQFLESVYPIYAPLYAVRAGMRTTEALKSFMLVAVAAEPPDPRLRDEILATGGVPEADRAYLARLAALLPDPAPQPVSDPLHEAQEAATRGDLDAAFPLALVAPPSLHRTRLLIACAEEFRTLAADHEAIAAVQAHNPREREDLFRIARDRKVWERITCRPVGASGDDGHDLRVPGDWVEWLEMLGETTVGAERLGDLARRGAVEWDPAMLADRPGRSRELAERLGDTHAPGAERLIREALPHLLGFLQRDVSWPRAEFIAIYQQLATLLVMESTGGDAELNLYLDLAGALLALGADEREYEEIVENGLELWKRFAAARTVTWVLDLVDLLAAHPAASEAARLRLLVAVAERLNTPSILRRMQPYQWDFFHLLCHDLGHGDVYFGLIQSQDGGETPAESDEDTFAQLAGRTVAVYTLTESVAHRVRDVLLDRCTDVTVEVCHDHVCTSRLRTLAKSADVFLVATGSAKHAATDCIESNLGSGALLRPTGRGSASMLAALQAHLASFGAT